MAFPHDLDTSPRAPLDRLSLAFAIDVAHGIATADGVLDAEELRQLGHVFPDRLLAEFGFVDEDGQLTEAFVVAREQARHVLAERLDVSRKLEILSLLHTMCVADGELHETEFVVLQSAATALDIAPEAFAAHLAQQPNSDSAPPPVRRPPWAQPTETD